MQFHDLTIDDLGLVWADELSVVRLIPDDKS